MKRFEVCRRYLWRLCFGLAAVFAGDGFAGDEVAIVLDFSGHVRCECSGTDGGELQLTQLLYPGDQLDLGSNGVVTLAVLKTASRHTLHGPERVRLSDTRLSLLDQGKEIAFGGGPAPDSPWASGSGTAPSTEAGGFSLASLKPGGMRLRGVEVPKVELTYPTPGGKIADMTPNLAWSTLPGASLYEIEVSSGNRVLHSFYSVSPPFQWPESSRLRPDTTYRVKIVAYGKDDTLGEGSAYLTTASPALLAEVRNRRPAANASRADMVAYGLELEQRELFDMANDYWKSLGIERQ